MEGCGLDSYGSGQGQMTVTNMANFYKLKAVIFSRGTLLYVVSYFVCLLGPQRSYMYRPTCNTVALLLVVKKYKVGSVEH
jgi:hypothetical protein